MQTPKAVNANVPAVPQRLADQKTKRHLAAIDLVTKALPPKEDPNRLKALKDLDNLKRLGTRLFLSLLEDDFVGFSYNYPGTLTTLTAFALARSGDRQTSELRSNRKDVGKSLAAAGKEFLNPTTVLVKTMSCGLCKEPHSGLTVILSNLKGAHVICPNLNHYLQVSILDKGTPASKKSKEVITFAMLNQAMYKTDFEIESSSESEADDLVLALLKTPR